MVKRLSHFSKKQAIYAFFAIVVLILSTNFLQETPIERKYFILQAAYMLILGIFMVIYFFSNIQKKLSINKEFLFFSFIILFAIFYPAFRAKQVFNQPLVYGVLSQRQWLLVETGFLLYYWLNTRKLSLELLEKIFIFCAWLFLIVYTVIYIFCYFGVWNTAMFGKFVKHTSHRGIRLHMTYFINFGFIYYFIKNEIKKSIKYAIFLILFFSYALFVYKGRTYIIFIGFTFFLFLYFRYPLNIKIFKNIKILLLLLIFLFAVFLIFPHYAERLIFMYKQMFKVLTGEITNDSSSNARLFQVLTVFGFFKSNPMLFLFGVGKLSHQWNAGFRGVLGYFHPTDIGVIGVVFLYGLIGFFVVYVFPLFKILKLTFKLNDKKENNCFVLTLKYLLFYIAVSSVLTGNIVFTPFVYSIPYFILYFYLKEKKSYEA